MKLFLKNAQIIKKTTFTRQLLLNLILDGNYIPIGNIS